MAIYCPSYMGLMVSRPHINSLTVWQFIPKGHTVARIVGTRFIASVAFTMFDFLTYTAIQNALVAGSLAAVLAAMAGYFLVVRGMTFTAHALPNVGFAGAAGAVVLGLEPLVGLLAFSISAAIAIGLLGKQLRERDITVGIIMAFALGLGALFISLYHGYAERVYSILYGNILGISQTDVLVTAMLSAVTISLLFILFRPLLFSSLDPTVAESRGIPVHSLTITFLILVSITISMSVQVVGALLIFTLLIGPPATAMRIVQRPLWAIVIAILLGVGYTCLGIFFAANGLFGISGTDMWPASVYITSLSFGVYLPVRFLSPLWVGRKARRHASASLKSGEVLFQERSSNHDRLVYETEDGLEISRARGK